MAYENSPHIVHETTGIKHYCTCGESANKPYCDGAHATKETGKSPQEFVVQEEKKMVICDCGHTGNSPFCDGAHSKL